MTLKTFIDDDHGYLAWIAENPEGLGLHPWTHRPAN